MNDGDGAYFAETGVKEAIVDPGAGTFPRYDRRNLWEFTAAGLYCFLLGWKYVIFMEQGEEFVQGRSLRSEKVGKSPLGQEGGGWSEKAMGFPGILKAHFNLGIMNL